MDRLYLKDALGKFTVDMTKLNSDSWKMDANNDWYTTDETVFERYKWIGKALLIAKNNDLEISLDNLAYYDELIFLTESYLALDNQELVHGYRIILSMFNKGGPQIIDRYGNIVMSGGYKDELVTNFMYDFPEFFDGIEKTFLKNTLTEALNEDGSVVWKVFSEYLHPDGKVESLWIASGCTDNPGKVDEKREKLKQKYHIKETYA